MKRALVWMLTGMMFLSVGCAQTLSAEKTASEEPKVIDMETGETDKAPEKELPKRTKAGERLEEIQKSGVLLIGISPDYAPFAFETTDEEGNTICAGSDVELGKYLAEELDVQAEFVKMEFDDCLKAAKEGTVDLVLLGMLPEKDRTAYVDFTDSYYEPGEQVLLVRKTQAEKFKTLDDFAGKTVEAQYGSLQAQLVTEQLPGELYGTFLIQRRTVCSRCGLERRMRQRWTGIWRKMCWRKMTNLIWRKQPSPMSRKALWPVWSREKVNYLRRSMN